MFEVELRASEGCERFGVVQDVSVGGVAVMRDEGKGGWVGVVVPGLHAIVGR